MDFAALMAAELSKSKAKTAAAAAASSTTTTTPAAKKYTKQADVEAARVAAYNAEQARLASAREAKARAKRQRDDELAEQDRLREDKRQRLATEARVCREERDREEERARRKRIGLPDLPSTGTADGEQLEAEKPTARSAEIDAEVEALSEDAVVQRLRELGLAKTLFGETGDDRRLRLAKTLKSLAAAAAKSESSSSTSSSAAAKQRGPIPTTLEFVPEQDMKVDGEVPPAGDKAGRTWVFRQLVSYFSMVLAEYGRAMEAEKRETLASRTAYNAMVQCRENMRPLFRKFEKDDIEHSLLVPIVEIVKAAQERRYVDANDGYLRLSIGKAAWPIGVTMVGIHERSAREKLHNGERGHVMGDEVTRKFLQSIKRCLTFAQVRWPPEDARQLMG